MTIDSTLKVRLFKTCCEIRSGSVNDSNVRALYGLLREHAHSKSLTREIGDFFAHPNRDRGIIKDRISGSVRKLIRNGVSGFKMKPAITHNAILSDLNKSLAPFGLSIPDSIGDAFCLVMFTPLSGSTISFKNGIRISLGIKLQANSMISQLAVVKKPIWEHCVALPVFTLPDVFGLPDYESLAPGTENAAALVVEFSNGILEVWQETPPVIMSEALQGRTPKMTHRGVFELRTGLVPPSEFGQ